MIRKVFFLIFIIAFLATVGGYLYLRSLQPQYEGKLTLEGLTAPVEVLYDSFGVPHIYAENQRDLFMALGYVHAQDRLFQMEMLRRVGGGRLSEILGEDFVKIDQFFRTLGIGEAGKEAVRQQYPQGIQTFQHLGEAYLQGLNAFLENGETPLEFTLLGIPAEPFTPEDLYNIAGYMSFSFAEAFKTDPLLEELKTKLGNAYLEDLQIDWAENAETIPVHFPDTTDMALLRGMHRDFGNLAEALPIPPWIGSNGWVVAPSKTASGQVLFCNDTHIGYSQPSVWYEAHLEAPGFSLYGNFLGGFPFPLVGHTRHHAWGLTMFENDDVDFYREKISEDGKQVMFKGEWKAMSLRYDTIKVKDTEPVPFEVRTTPHGPVINGLVDGVDSTASPVSVWWMYTKKPLRILEAAYWLSFSNSLEEFSRAAAMIHAPGLNVMYGDAEGNIAWWAVGQMFERPPSAQSKLFLNGSSGDDEIVRFLDFSYNPQAVNPPAGFVYSANNQPDSVKGFYYPGYYVPEDRARRITDLLASENGWTVEKMKAVITDGTNPVHQSLAVEMVKASGLKQTSSLPDDKKGMLEILETWTGDYQTEAAAPTIFNTWLYHTLKATMHDEMGDTLFQSFLQTHLMKRTLDDLLKKEGSLWWDDLRTPVIETRQQVFQQAFDSAYASLSGRLGGSPSEWQWGKVHTVEHKHVLAAQKPLDAVFNVGPFPINGGNETVNNQGFYLDDDGQFEVLFGPAMRIIIDFADLENAQSVLPTGQSGNLMSEFYDNQAEAFVTGKFREMKMGEADIRANRKYALRFVPQ